MGMRSEPGASARTVVTQAALAEILGVTPRTIRDLQAAGCMMADPGTRRYHLGTAIQAYIAHLRGRVRTGPAAIDYEQERARLTRAQADRAEVRLGRERGRLVPEAAARKALSAVLVPLRQELLSLEVSVPPQLEQVGTAAERRDLLARAVREILDRVSRPDIRWEDGDAAFDVEGDDALHPDDPEESAATASDP